MSDIDSFRADKDRFFASHPHSPLTRDQKCSFGGLKYYPVSAALSLTVTMEEFTSRETITLQTTTGSTQTYTRFGRFRFSVDGQDAELTVFASAEGFFLPFADVQAGIETYGSGRYLEPKPLGSGKFLVDFNYAYNPYCAYNDAWSCPLTPPENRLKVAIRAGEKIFH